MGFIARAVSIVSNRISMNFGGGFSAECEHAQPLGDDSKPITSDDGVAVKTGRAGRFVVHGFFDYDNKIASAGEKRIYGRDSEGNSVSHVYLKNDGTILIANDSASTTINSDGSVVDTNGSGTVAIEANGEVNINGVTISTDGTIESPVSIISPSAIINFKELAEHSHTTSWTAAAGTGTTGVNT